MVETGRRNLTRVSKHLSAAEEIVIAMCILQAGGAHEGPFRYHCSRNLNTVAVRCRVIARGRNRPPCSTRHVSLILAPPPIAEP